ncbi:MAG TPA: ferritin-like domain-containing protein [Terriglobia bacterium]|nr:ferritin-like domain-containing protein [Terriglobia bacterium]
MSDARKEKNTELVFSRQEVTDRDPKYKPTDINALRAIAQAAINVEEFTIPLYMCAMYSIQGMHQITGDNNLYQGRLWPGNATVSRPGTTNAEAFNLVFKVFIEEMLHLQLAANIATASGAVPDFTSNALMTDTDYAWTCYGPDLTILPHILDFKDVKSDPDPNKDYSRIKVKLDSLNKEQIKLFLAIEETEEMAEERIKPDKRYKYFPSVPFKDWTPQKDEKDLPLFGSIGWMYLSLWRYIDIEYSDGTTLWETVFTPNSSQRDIFNEMNSGHPKEEYPGFNATITATEPAQARLQVLNMIRAITDQGEGKSVGDMIRRMLGLLTAVDKEYQADKPGLEADYMSYNDVGQNVPSTDAAARADSPQVSMDHYEAFTEVQKLVDAGSILTWDKWHELGNNWKPADLKTDSYDKNKYPLPTADDIAGALNRLKAKDTKNQNYTQFCQASAGAIAGVTRVLNDYWTKDKIAFPFPSMAGSGDRMSICWAIFGKIPDISTGTKERKPGVLYHSCQSLSLTASGSQSPACAGVEVYHSCRGSNDCKAEGGCGFVQDVNGGGGGCSSKVTFALSGDRDTPGPLCGAPVLYSAPSDNKCGGLGGCAVPISASQLYPKPAKGDTATMQLYDFEGSDFEPIIIGTMQYGEGDLVYDIAWVAYMKVLAHRGQPIPQKPAPSDFRLAFPPST